MMKEWTKRSLAEQAKRAEQQGKEQQATRERMKKSPEYHELLPFKRLFREDEP
jgi:hypothetical protein